jgi:hypothetical protein
VGGELIQGLLRPELSWTHYRLLLRVDNSKAREWYMNEAADQNWSTRQLDRQISSLYFERLLASREKEPVKQEAREKLAQLEPLLLIPTYVLDFLCIHPFLDGNGRMARLLTLLLLYKAGYEVGRYISLEQMVEHTKESYYDTLYASSQGWHETKHAILPWWEYFLGVMLFGAYQDFERRVGLITTGRGTKTAMVLDAIAHFIGDFTIRDLQEGCPHVGIDLIRRILREQKNAGNLVCLGRGPNAKWRNK